MKSRSDLNPFKIKESWYDDYWLKYEPIESPRWIERVFQVVAFCGRVQRTALMPRNTVRGGTGLRGFGARAGSSSGLSARRW
jgi:hypothetical protein